MKTAKKTVKKVGRARHRSDERHIYLTLDDEAKGMLSRYLRDQRVQPTRAAVLLVALKEFLGRELGA